VPAGSVTDDDDRRQQNNTGALGGPVINQKKRKARFGHLIRPLTWKWNGSVLLEEVDHSGSK